MKNKWVLILSLLLPALASADWADIEVTEFPLSPPPKAGSVADQKDYKKLHEYQETRTQEQCDLGNSQGIPSFEVFFGSGWDGLTEKEIAASEEKIVAAMKYTEKVSGFWKAKYKRPRPYNVDEDLVPCVDNPPKGAKAYPSSHAAMAAIGACLLAEKFPDKAKEIKTRGKLLGELRVIVGVHHPSDVAKGRELGEKICERLLTEPDFKL